MTDRLKDDNYYKLVRLRAKQQEKIERVKGLKKNALASAFESDDIGYDKAISDVLKIMEEK